MDDWLDDFSDLADDPILKAQLAEDETFNDPPF
jgi:hypothetical protein